MAPGAEMVFSLALSTGLFSHELLHWHGRYFDRAVSNRLLIGSPGVFVGMPYSCLRSFIIAKNQGWTTVLNHVNANFRTENESWRYEAEMACDLEERKEILREQWPARTVQLVDEEVSHADFVLVPSTFVRDDLVSRGLSRDKIFMIPYGVDTSRFHAQSKPSESRALRVLYVGQIGYRKGLRYLIDAVGLADPRRTRLTLIGPVVNRNRILDRAPQIYTYHGTMPQSALMLQYSQADVFVLPSLAEGMARVVLEAMACGLPVIITPETGFEGIVRDGVEGFVVQTRDSRAIADRLGLLASDRHLRQQLGQAARKRAEEFSWARFRETFLAELQRVVCRSDGHG